MPVCLNVMAKPEADLTQPENVETDEAAKKVVLRSRDFFVARAQVAQSNTRQKDRGFYDFLVMGRRWSGNDAPVLGGAEDDGGSDGERAGRSQSQKTVDVPPVQL